MLLVQGVANAVQTALDVGALLAAQVMVALAIVLEAPPSLAELVGQVFALAATDRAHLDRVVNAGGEVVDLLHQLAVVVVTPLAVPLSVRGRRRCEQRRRGQ